MAYAPYLAFSIKGDTDAGALAERLRITSTGSVGIGTTSPQVPCDVNGAIRTISATFAAPTSGAGLEIRYVSSLDAASLLSFNRSTAAYKPYLVDASYQAFSISGSEKMRIDSTGSVGIGTASPAAKLHVSLGGSAPSLVSAANTVAVFQNFATVNDLARFCILSGTAGQSIIQMGDSADDDIGSIVYDNSINAFSFRTDNVSNRMVIDSSGNVGIGVTSPAYKLEIVTDSAGKPGISGLWSVTSDERIKTDIVPANLDRCYEIVKSVPLKHFGFAPGVYTDDQVNDKHGLGWIAQDVQKVFSKAVSVKPFTFKTEIPDGTEEYTEQDFTLETVEKTETSIQVIDGKPVQVSKVVTSENKVLLFYSVDVTDEAGVAVMDGDKPLTYQMPRMVTKTRNKVRHDVIEDCLDLNGGQMIAALYGAVQAIMNKLEVLTARN